MLRSLRAQLQLLVALLVLAAVALTGWAVNQRINAGARREGDLQARARLAQAQALYGERTATLAAEAEAVSFYPAVIAAVAGENPAPLRQWSAEVATAQGVSVTVVDARGVVLARGHAPDHTGDLLSPQLAGLRLALAGQKVSGAEAGDELGLALRGYAPVVQNGVVQGAVMIAAPLDAALLQRLAGGAGGTAIVSVDGQPAAQDGCAPAASATTTRCTATLRAPDGSRAAALALTVSLAAIGQAREAAQRTLVVVLGLALTGGLAAALLLARTLTGPLTRLTVAAGRIAEGDYARPVTAGGAKEIGVLACALDTMRQRVAESAQALRDERDVLEAVVESVGDGILMTGLDGIPRVENARWGDLLGGVGSPVAETLRQVGGDARLADALRVWGREPERTITATFASAEPFRSIALYSAPVRHRATRVPPGGTGRVFVLHDLTRESEAERLRAALIATVTHELRSPLTIIVGYGSSLLDGDPADTATTQEFLQIMLEAAGKLGALVDNLLDAAQLDAGVLRLQREPVQVARVVETVLTQQRQLHPERELRAVIDPTLPLADADARRVEQVVTNLVENAIKYSPNGGPISVRARSGPQLTVEVEDRGVGIPPDEQSRVFERFARVESRLTRATRGVGLGLFICKSLVEAQDGRIWVESEQGVGSRFAFTLPRLAGGAGAAEPRTTGARWATPPRWSTETGR